MRHVYHEFKTCAIFSHAADARGNPYHRKRYKACIYDPVLPREEEKTGDPVLNTHSYILGMDDSLARRHSETRGPTVLGLSISFTVFSTICVLLRVYTRRVILHTFGLEDAAIVIAQILSICVTVTTGLREFSMSLVRHSESLLTSRRGAMGFGATLGVYCH